MTPRPAIEPRTFLTTVSVVQFFSNRAGKYLHRDVIHERATGSSLFDGYKWVWNVSSSFPGGPIPELRFWSSEVVAPENTRQLTLDQIIESILPPSRARYHSGEVETNLLCISGPLLMDLREELNGKLAANSSFFPRAGLEAFLRRRWLGNAERGTRNAETKMEAVL